MSQRNWSVIDWVLTRLRGYPRPALEGMRLGPTASSENGVMASPDCWKNLSENILKVYQIQFFTWDCMHPSRTWWQHFEMEVPRLAELGVTQVWLPPPHKAMTAACILHYPTSTQC